MSTPGTLSDQLMHETSDGCPMSTTQHQRSSKLSGALPILNSLEGVTDEDLRQIFIKQEYARNLAKFRTIEQIVEVHVQAARIQARRTQGKHKK